MKEVSSILLILTIFLPFSFLACHQPLPLTPEEFQTKMKQHDFLVYPLEIKNQEPALQDYWCAKNQHFQIEYLRFRGSQEAKSFFHQKKKDFLQWKGEVSLVKKREKRKSAFYSQNNLITYGGISCVENTIIYYKNKAEFFHEIDGVLVLLGY